MTTLITIPDVAAFHLPAPGATPVPLAQGGLALSLLPAAPPTRPAEVLTLSVGSSAFVLARNSPVQKTKSKNEHPSFVFTPAPRDDGRSIGQVRIDMKDSTNPDAWEATEQACAALQAELKAHSMWEDKLLFVDDEYETGGPITGPKVGWGESIASNVLWAGNALASRLSGRAAAEPVLPTSAPTSYSYTATLASPNTQAPAAAPASPTDDFKALASNSWHQATIAAQGLGAAAVAVGGALGEQARHTIDSLGTAGGPPATTQAASPTATTTITTAPPPAAKAAEVAEVPAEVAEPTGPAPPDGYTVTETTSAPAAAPEASK